jgi:hypothetical protein
VNQPAERRIAYSGNPGTKDHSVSRRRHSLTARARLAQYDPVVTRNCGEQTVATGSRRRQAARLAIVDDYAVKLVLVVRL